MSRAHLVVLVAAGLVTSGCTTAGPATGTQTSTEPQRLTVYAAASLQKTFTELGDRFESAHPGTTVTFNFAGSSDLVTQLQQGAPADVFASADEKNMTKATDDKLIDGTPVVFASNTLQIVVPPGNPAEVTSFADLSAPGLKLVICAPQVPCGSATKKVSEAQGITLKPVSEENSVTDVLNKVASGEADAGLVYRTDVQGAGARVVGVSFPHADKAVNRYPIALLAGSDHPELAREFVALVTGAEGQKVLSTAGFGKP